MRRTLRALLAATVLALGTAAPAAAGVFDASGSQAGVGIAGLPPITTGVTGPGTVTVSGGVVTERPTVFQTSGTLGTTLFTDIPNVTNITFTATKPASTATFQSGFSTPNPVGRGTLSGVGGVGALAGQSVIQLFGGALRLTISHDAIGGPAGGTAPVFAQDFTLILTGAPWVTGSAQITWITTTTPEGQVVNTTTMAGGLTRNGSPITTGQMSGAGGTNLTLVSPFRVETGGLLGTFRPGFATQTLHFVPEPGTLLLLGSGVAGLALVGRRQMRG